MSDARGGWIAFAPRLGSPRADATFVALVGALGASAAPWRCPSSDRMETALSDALAVARVLKDGSGQRLSAAARVLIDLCRQGWVLHLPKPGAALLLSAPEQLTDVMEEKRRVRAQLRVTSDEQLNTTAARDFIRRMEVRRLHGREWLSVSELMRDGRELASRLVASTALPPDRRAAALRDVIRPYIQPVREDARCEHTGLLLQDIWRYFRHTWASAYKTTPGRNVNILIRDAAAPHHPVIGVAALISSAAQIGIRDDWIGWSSDAVLRAMQDEPTAEWARWLRDIWNRSLYEVYVVDFLEDGLIKPADLQAPNAALIKRLTQYAQEQRKRHERFADGAQHKAEVEEDNDGEPDWIGRALTPLYKSKRALRLVMLLQAKLSLDAHMPTPTADGLRALLSVAAGRQAISALARRAKAEKMGVAIADISVCGAVAPYNHLLGGKLVSMLMVSPEVSAIYAERYDNFDSIIASSTAGRAIKREPSLALLMTTSLYGAGSSQYNRVRIPCERVGGAPGEQVTYILRGLTEGYGTSQFSDETVDALAVMLSKAKQGLRVNSIFGEGANPRLRKAREGLDELGLPSDTLMKHGSPKVVYAVPLVSNLRRFLLGLDDEPAHLFAQSDPTDRTEQIVDWWRERWLAMRIANQDVLRRVAGETTIAPIRHGARVVLPEKDDVLEDLFG